MARIYQKPIVMKKAEVAVPDFAKFLDRICNDIVIDASNNIVLNCNGLDEDIEKIEIVGNDKLISFLTTKDDSLDVQ